MRAELAHGLLQGMGQRVPSKLIDFGRALAAALPFHDWPYFLEKPDKWADEYAAWADADYPQEGDATWDEFVVAMDVLANA